MITKNKFVFAAIFVIAGLGPILLTVAVNQRGDTVAKQAPTTSQEVAELGN